MGQINSNGTTSFTNTNAYSGNNPRAVILGSDGKFYAVGNAGNGAGDGNTSSLTGIQQITPGGNPNSNSTKIGTYNVTENGYPADKSAKDNNFRGLTVFNNQLFVTKGSGSNGIDTVYQVNAGAGLPTNGDANTPISIMPGLPTNLAKSNTAFFPFGVWFANATTMYVGDEGDGVLTDAAGDIHAGLQKWTFDGGTGKWVLDYTLQSGLNLGQNYSVTGCDQANDCGTYTTATDGLRNITGKVNADGTVTIYGVTSTASVGTGDEGADPDKVVAINDLLSATAFSQASGESFDTLETAAYGQVLRGVALVTPVPEPGAWALMMAGLFCIGATLRRRHEVDPAQA